MRSRSESKNDFTESSSSVYCRCDGLDYQLKSQEDGNLGGCRNLCRLTRKEGLCE